MQERREIILGPRGTTSRRADAVLPTDVLGELLELDAWVAEVGEDQGCLGCAAGSLPGRWVRNQRRRHLPLCERSQRALGV